MGSEPKSPHVRDEMDPRLPIRAKRALLSDGIVSRGKAELVSGVVSALNGRSQALSNFDEQNWAVSASAITPSNRVANAASFQN